MKKKIMKLLESTVEGDIELALSLILKHIPEEIEELFNHINNYSFRNIKLYIIYENKIYRTSIAGFLLKTILNEENLSQSGFREVTL